MRPDTELDHRERVLRVLICIQQRLDEDLTPAILARIAHFSPFHFHRVFRGTVGESVGDHVRRLRLERAAWTLRSTDRSVLSIALESGYQAHESFTRAFGTHFGMSPASYRSSADPGAFPPSPSGIHYYPGSDMTFEPTPLEKTNMKIEIETIERQRVAYIEHRGPYNEIGEVFKKLGMYAGMRGLMGPNTSFFGVYYDDPESTPAEDLRSEVCISVGDGFDGDENHNIGIKEIGGGEYAVAIHEGTYDNLPDTYCHVMGQWLPKQGREVGDGPCIERYLNDCRNTPPEDLRTAVCVPIK